MGRKNKNFGFPRQDISEEKQLEIKEKMKEEYGPEKGEEVFFKSRSAGKFDEKEQQLQELPVSRNCVHFDKAGNCYKGDEVDDQTGIRFVDGCAVSR